MEGNVNVINEFDLKDDYEYICIKLDEIKKFVSRSKCLSVLDDEIFDYLADIEGLIYEYINDQLEIFFN